MRIEVASGQWSVVRAQRDGPKRLCRWRSVEGELTAGARDAPHVNVLRQSGVGDAALKKNDARMAANAT